MELTEIKAKIVSEDPQDRMKAITALKDFGPEVAVPLLLTRKDDQEFMIRSFVAMGLGHKRSPEAYEALTEIVRNDNDANVRSEAANSLGKYGECAIPILLEAFNENEHWLMRLSLFPILEVLAIEEKLSQEQFFTLCETAIQDRDVMVKSAGLTALKYFAQSNYEEASLGHLEKYCKAKRWYLRRQTAICIRSFQSNKANSILSQLKQDEDHRVVAATLESLVA